MYFVCELVYWSTGGKGPFIKDVCKIFGIFEPPSPISADVLYKWSLRY